MRCANVWHFFMMIERYICKSNIFISLKMIFLPTYLPLLHKKELNSSRIVYNSLKALTLDDFLVHVFFYISNIFISNTRLKLTKNQANTKQPVAKQHPDIELLLFEYYLYSSSKFSSKIIHTINHNENEDKKEKQTT